MIIHEGIRRTELIDIFDKNCSAVLVTAACNAIDTVTADYRKGTIVDSPPHLPPDARDAIIDDFPDCPANGITNHVLL